MPNTTYFVQDCPTCGRRLQVRVEYLGRRVACQHCHGVFVATDPSNLGADSGSVILRRANELLSTMGDDLSDVETLTCRQTVDALHHG
jgi:DNA-directed RNA polymerase subunit RPC12/RpoP